MCLEIYSITLSFLLSILLSLSSTIAAPTSEYGNIALTSGSSVSQSEVNVVKRSTMRIECQPGSKPQVAIADADESIMYCCPQGYTVVGQRYIEGWVCCDDELTRGQCINGKHDDFRGGKTPLKCWIDGILTDTVDRDRAKGFQVCQALATNPKTRNLDEMVGNAVDEYVEDLDLVKRDVPDQLSDIDFEKWCSVRQDPRFCPRQFMHSDGAVDVSSDKRKEHSVRDTNFCINYPHHKDCQPPYTDVNSDPPTAPVGTHLTRRSHNVVCPAGTISSTVEDFCGEVIGRVRIS